ncbi:TRAP transporter small permease subunit [Pseudomonas stutzeri]|uniref:TRAP transporter small permease n=1 Tax=Stutzerimonas stutzeri TaxID=316 RepID=UPI00190B9609|nr:TRAP transporter small permease [Stutzerimonas stutzeri]MBK3869544.1 TRAP transporter small permease subunit [Stutzerimonas stutzeri]
MYKLLDTASRQMNAATTILGCICALVMALALLAGVFYRYVLNASLSWTDEVALLAFSWTVFLFASVLVREQLHVRITLVVDLLPASFRAMLERLSIVLVMVFGALMLGAGWQFTAFTAHQVSPALRYPLWLQGSAVPVSGALILLHALPLLIRARISEEQGAEA